MSSRRCAGRRDTVRLSQAGTQLPEDLDEGFRRTALRAGELALPPLEAALNAP